MSPPAITEKSSDSESDVPPDTSVAENGAEIAYAEQKLMLPLVITLAGAAFLNVCPNAKLTVNCADSTRLYRCNRL